MTVKTYKTLRDVPEGLTYEQFLVWAKENLPLIRLNTKDGFLIMGDGTEKATVAKAPVKGNWQSIPIDELPAFSAKWKTMGLHARYAEAYVADLDVKDPNAPGVEQWKWIGQRLGFDPFPDNTLQVQSPSSGEHVYFALPAGVTIPGSLPAWLRKELLEAFPGKKCGIDIRANTGQIVFVGSELHKDGQVYTYKVKHWGSGIATIPSPLLDAYAKQAEMDANETADREKRRAEYEKTWRAEGEKQFSDDCGCPHRLTHHIRENARAEIRQHPSNKKTGRDSFLNKLAFDLASNGLTEDQVWETVGQPAAALWGDKTEDSLRRAVRKAYMDGSAEYSPFDPKYADKYATPTGEQGSTQNASTVKPKLTVDFKPADYSVTKLEEAIEKVKTLEAGTTLAKTLASSGISDALWRDTLSSHLGSIIDGRNGTPKFTHDEVANAVKKGIDRKSRGFDTHEKFLTDEALTRKRTTFREAKEEAAAAKGVPTADRMTADDLSDYLASKVDGKLIYLPELDERRTYEPNGLWAQVDNENTQVDVLLKREFSKLRDIYDEMPAKEELGIVNKYLNKRERKVIISTLANEPNLKASAREFQMGSDGIAVGNGQYYDFTTGVARPLVPEDRYTAATPVAYVPGKRDPRIDTLMETFPEDCRQYVLEVFAYTIIPKAKKEAYFIEGPGDSGKTKLGTLHRQSFSPFADFTGSSVFSSKNPSKVEDRNVVFLNKRGVFIDELPESGELDETHFKSVIGATILPARYLFGQIDQHLVWFTLLVFTNHAPKFFEPDDATKNRVVIIPAELRYCADPLLPHERLANPDVDEWVHDTDLQEAWLSLMVETAAGIYKNGMSERPASVVRKTAEWRAEANPFADDVQAYLVRTGDEKDMVVLSDLAEEINYYKSDAQTKFKISANGLKNKFEKMSELHAFGTPQRLRAFGDKERSLPPYLKRVKEKQWNDSMRCYEEKDRQPTELPPRIVALTGVRFKTAQERFADVVDEVVHNTQVPNSPEGLVETEVTPAHESATTTPVEVDDELPYYGEDLGDDEFENAEVHPW